MRCGQEADQAGHAGGLVCARRCGAKGWGGGRWEGGEGEERGGGSAADGGQGGEMAEEVPAEGAAPVAEKPKKVRTVKVLSSTLEPDGLKDAIEVCVSAFDRARNPKDLAQVIKREYDKRYPSELKATSGVWHCLVGSNFGCSVAHETRCYLHLSVGKEHIILFRSKDSPFD